MKKISAVLGPIVFVVFMATVMTGRGKGFVYSLIWDGQSTLMCGGSFVMSFTGKKIRMTTGPVFSVGGDCELTCTDCDIEASVVVDGGGGAHVLLKGGKIRGTDAAIRIGGNAVVEIDGTEVIGKIKRGGSARVEGLPKDDKRVKGQVSAAGQKKSEKYRAEICKDLLPCYDETEETGNVSGKLAARIAQDGTVTKVKVKTGASKKLKKCMKARVKKRKLEGYDLGPAKITCQWAGTYMAGTQMMTFNSGFKATPAGKK